MSRRRRKQLKGYQLAVLVTILILSAVVGALQKEPAVDANRNETISISDLPAYSGEPYVILNGNKPDFGENLNDTLVYEEYGQLDSLGRCTEAIACIDESLMPTEDRGDIGSVKPTGWQSVKYDFVDGNSLYNRCHLIGFQLTGENANEQNLITGTRYMNVEGMLPFENMIADYIKETGNRVLYRVTPVFDGRELVARGVQLEACSIEDGGNGVCFNVYCYNVQPGVEIDYATGESRETEFTCDHGDQMYVLNTSSGKYHRSDCSGVKDMKPENREEFSGCYEELEAKGYEACNSCDLDAA